MIASNPAGLSRSQLREHRKSNLFEYVKVLATEKGVHGVLVTSEKWELIETTFESSLTKYWIHHMQNVEDLGIALIRDSEPSDELKFLRLQTKKFELLLGLAVDHRMLVIYSKRKRPLKNIGEALRKHEQEAQKKAKAEKEPGIPAMDPCSVRQKFAKRICRKKCEIHSEDIKSQRRRPNKESAHPSAMESTRMPRPTVKPKVLTQQSKVTVTENIRGEDHRDD